VDMDISMDIHGKSVDMDMDMDGKFHIHGKPEDCVMAVGDGRSCSLLLRLLSVGYVKVGIRYTYPERYRQLKENVTER